MESNDKLKEIDIKNCICYYFNDIIRVEDFYFNILFDEKSYEYTCKNILIYDISQNVYGCKTIAY